MSLTRPNPFLSKWAENGKRFDVPDNGADHSNGRADIQTGFPEETMKSVLQGGVPPWGQDHNGILHQITEATQWTQAGGLPTFNEALRNRMGGYPLGAELQSTRHGYISYINMMDGNLADPDTGTKADDYWRNDGNPGNGWAIKTILSDDTDSISYLDGNLRIVTKVAGAKSDLYVRLDPPSSKPDGSQENPYTNVQDAINAIPDGGSGNIYLWQPNVFTLDNWDMGRRSINFYPWCKDNTLIDLQAKLISNIYFSSIYTMKNYDRVQVNINITKGTAIPNTYDPGGFHGSSGKAIFLGFNFVATQKIPDGFTMNGASPFAPEITYQFIGCIFTNVDYLDFWFNGWQNHITYDIQFDRCLIKADQAKFIQIGNGTVNINASEDGDWTFAQGLTDMDIGYLEGNNSYSFLQKTVNYSNFKMKVTGYSDRSGKNPIYYPNGLNTNFDLIFS